MRIAVGRPVLLEEIGDRSSITPPGLIPVWCAVVGK